MHQIQLEIFDNINGIGSASGLYLKNELLYVIGDNSAYLNEYHIASKKLNKIRILLNQGEQPLENIPKALKPDFEVLCNHQEMLYILGSGSTPKRNLMIEYNSDTQSVKEKDLSQLYEKLRKTAVIDQENFNIEGAVFTGTEWFLFNRGNGVSSKNGIFKIKGADLGQATQIAFTDIALPHINHIASSFTDAIVHDNEIFFIASAEDTHSTYTDGEILGSFIGGINPESLTLNFAHKISGKHKFEGISFFKQTEKDITFLLCEDRDTEELKTTIYSLTLTV